MSNSANVPAVASEKILPALGSLAGYEVVKVVSRSILRQEDDVPFYVEFESVSRVAEALEKTAGRPRQDPPKIADVINLESGEFSILIMNAVLESELNRNYPNGGYVGRKFAIVRGNHPEATDTDKRYKLYRILELREKANGAMASAGKPTIDGTAPEAVAHAKASKAKA